MNADLAEFLKVHAPLAEETVTWADGAMPLRVTTCLSDRQPPLGYVSSVRGLVLRSGDVLVVHDAGGAVHILPGGRREADETLEVTLRRELLEETGWAITRIAPLGYLHYHHLSERPAGYAYPYPDFLQCVYLAHAESFDAAAMEVGGDELASYFAPANAVQDLGVPVSQCLLLDAALSRPGRAR